MGMEDKRIPGNAQAGYPGVCNAMANKETLQQMRGREGSFLEVVLELHTLAR